MVIFGLRTEGKLDEYFVKSNKRLNEKAALIFSDSYIRKLDKDHVVIKLEPNLPAIHFVFLLGGIVAFVFGWFPGVYIGVGSFLFFAFTRSRYLYYLGSLLGKNRGKYEGKIRLMSDQKLVEVLLHGTN